MTTQTDINASLTAQQALNRIRGAAYVAHAKYPQYDGRWDGPEWRLGRITRRVRTKMGIAFEQGDIVLFRQDPDEPRFTAYSVRNGIDTAVPDRTLEAFQ